MPAGYGDPELGAKPIPDMLAFFKKQFDARYNGGRNPLQINTYVEWCARDGGRSGCSAGLPLRARMLLAPSPPTRTHTLTHPRAARCRLAKDPKNAKAVKDFIDYAQSKPDVYFITYSDLIYWMQVCVARVRYWGGMGQRGGVRGGA